MKRRAFINTGVLATFGGLFFAPDLMAGNKGQSAKSIRGKAKNIIFMVSDGMSNGTLNMSDLLSRQKYGRPTHWIQLYHENKATRAYMITASADSLVTDSAAASSAWGGGVKVKNGSLNVNADKTANKPILQKFKQAGKAVGCITTVPVTHATPAGFCIASSSRGSQEEIASMYLNLYFDVMMGAGMNYFSAEKRSDHKDMLAAFRSQGYQVALNKAEMNQTTAGKPLLGIFGDEGLPYTIDRQADSKLLETVPSLAEMTQKALSLMSQNPNGFVLQVEGGKVDWAAHANDAAALLYDQLAFDEAIGIAIAFAEKNKDTLVIITTDHGNSNPGLIKSMNVDTKFNLMNHVRHSNDWILNGITRDYTPRQVIERVIEALGIVLTESEAKSILEDYASLSNEGTYNSYKLPFRKLAQIQQNYTSIGWSGMDHAADYVELAMFGPGSEALPRIVQNTDLHNYMLNVAGLI